MFQRGIQPEKEREGEGERERIDTRRARFPRNCFFLYFPEKLLYFKLYIEINVRSKVMQGQLLSPLSKDRVFFAYLCSSKGLTFVYNIFLSGD